jgi:hypothetical protein
LNLQESQSSVLILKLVTQTLISSPAENSNRLVKMFSKNEFIPSFPRILVSKSRKLSIEYLTIRIYLEDKVSSMSIYITLLIIECYLL